MFHPYFASHVFLLLLTKYTPGLSYTQQPPIVEDFAYMDGIADHAPPRLPTISAARTSLVAPVVPPGFPALPHGGSSAASAPRTATDVTPLVAPTVPPGFLALPCASPSPTLTHLRLHHKRPRASLPAHLHHARQQVLSRHHPRMVPHQHPRPPPLDLYNSSTAVSPRRHLLLPPSSPLSCRPPCPRVSSRFHPSRTSTP